MHVARHAVPPNGRAITGRQSSAHACAALTRKLGAGAGEEGLDGVRCSLHQRLLTLLLPPAHKLLGSRVAAAGACTVGDHVSTGRQKGRRTLCSGL